MHAFKKLSSENKQRYKQAILDLYNSADPRKLGVSKQGRYRGYYAYEMGRSFRLVYKVIDDEKRIHIVLVGDHKQVYGYDD